MGRRARRGHLVMLMGAPGSGKSTYAEGYQHVITTDALRTAPRGIDGHVTGDAVGRIYRLAFGSLSRALRAGREVVFDSPALSSSTRRQALELAWRHRARATLVAFDVPLETCLARQVGREHPVAEHVVRTMWERYAPERKLAGLEPWDEVLCG